jgi:hypothetical protein
MSTVDEILGHTDIAHYLSTHEGAATAVRRAAEALKESNDAIPALQKLLPALSEKTVHVFFSYKQKDKRTADTIVKLLRKHGGRSLSISYMGDFTEEIAGKKWRDAIRCKVREANWFVLLLSDPSEDWDWCLFETGLFEMQLTSADRLICLHHPEIKLPDPIKDYHAVPALQESIEDFLKMTFVNDDPIFGMEAINPAVVDEIPEIAKKIVEAIVPPRRMLYHQIFEPWLELRIPGIENMMAKEELDRAVVVAANPSALDVFGFAVQPGTFGELRSGLPEQSTGDSRWLDELFHVVRKITKGYKVVPIQAVFQNEDGKMYRPVLCAVDRTQRNGPIETYHVSFSEEVSHVDDTAIPRPLAELATILRFAFRFRWEVLERFGNRTLTEDDVVRVENAFNRIETDWRSRGMTIDGSFMALFPPEKVGRVNEFLGFWRTLRNREGTGQLDIAIENRDIHTISAVLGNCIPLNQEFVEIVAIRFSEQASGKEK